MDNAPSTDEQPALDQLAVIEAELAEAEAELEALDASSDVSQSAE